MSEYREKYKSIIKKLQNDINAFQQTLLEIANLKKEASDKVTIEESKINDTLHFLELEEGIMDDVTINCGKIIKLSRQQRRDAKMILQDFNNFQKHSTISFPDLEKILNNLSATISNYITMDDKTLVYNSKSIDFEKLKKGEDNVQYS